MFIVNVEGAIVCENQWLLIKRSEKEDHAGGLLSLVGGKVESEGNSRDVLERTLRREIYEEVGVYVSNLRYVNSSSFISDTGDHVVDIVFLCDFDSGNPFTKSPDEVDEVFWMTTENILSHSNAPSYLKENIKMASHLLKKSC
ncbi:NUDIX hydrolase [Piscibacillus halophilus]|uniref:NUDIX hydrolase n=1 Tax=Piscibacillus halophilus TaxID=571933 RepID=UPI00158A422D|nr:NUDIX domain-containing protein [Piscibacillus halophilus]